MLHRFGMSEFSESEIQLSQDVVHVHLLWFLKKRLLNTNLYYVSNKHGRSATLANIWCSVSGWNYSTNTKTAIQDA